MSGNAKLTIFVPKEIRSDETRVAATPDSVKKYIEWGCSVIIEEGAGAAASIADVDFKAAGAAIEKDAKKGYAAADITIAVNPPAMHPKARKHQLCLMKKGATWVSFLVPQSEPDALKEVENNKLSLLSMNLIPRISRAQKMDALTSQSNIAGYKAAIMAAGRLGKIFPLMMTAAGTIQPAKVIVLGAGVAGLQAIATAKRLGAHVEASDVRPAVKEQVESLGAKFIDVPFEEGVEDKGGYAKEASKEYIQRQKEEIEKRLPEADVVITTALIPGKKAPILLTEEQVKLMRPGSVIVDMASEQGGNCALTEPGKDAVKHGVTIMGTSNIPATVPVHTTQLYARNVLALLQGLIKDGKLIFTMEDEVVAGALVARDGGIVHPSLKEEKSKPAKLDTPKGKSKKGGSFS